MEHRTYMTYSAVNNHVKHHEYKYQSRMLHVGPHLPVPYPIHPPTHSPIVESEAPSTVPSYIPTSLDFQNGMSMMSKRTKYPSTNPSYTPAEVFSLYPSVQPSGEISSHPPSQVPSDVSSSVPSFFAASMDYANKNSGGNGKGSTDNHSAIQPDADENVDGKGRRMMLMLSLVMMNGR